MSEAKRTLTKSEIHALIDERLIVALRETGFFLGTALPVIIAAVQHPAELEKVAEMMRQTLEHGPEEGLIGISALAQGFLAAIESDEGEADPH